MDIPPPSRLLRASAFAAVCVLLTSAGHVAASGRLLEPWHLLVAFAGVLAVALLLAGHERSFATICGGLLGGQFMLHALFAALMTGNPHHMAVQPVVLGHAHSSTGMTMAHLLAAFGCGWWLRRGERRAWRLARQAARALVRPFLLIFFVLAAPARGAVVSPAAPARRVTAVLRHVLVLRGPPVRFPVSGRA